MRTSTRTIGTGLLAAIAASALALALMSGGAAADIPWEEPGDACFGIQNVVTNPGDSARHGNMNEDAKDRLVDLVDENCDGATDGAWWGGHPDSPIGEWVPPGQR